eukprot:scaffold256_cov159-Amphora_coffeaeformis.AAC.7
MEQTTTTRRRRPHPTTMMGRNTVSHKKNKETVVVRWAFFCSLLALIQPITPFVPRPELAHHHHRVATATTTTTRHGKDDANHGTHVFPTTWQQSHASSIRQRLALASATVNRADTTQSASSSNHLPKKAVHRSSTHKQQAPQHHDGTVVNAKTHHHHPSRAKTKNQIRQKFQKAKALERQGQWRKAIRLLRQIVDTDDVTDAYSHLALAKLEARRHNTTAAAASFLRGTTACPDSIHLWQAWAVHEESLGHLSEARNLYERALELDQHNPYVCHAYGLMEYRLSNKEAAQRLWEQALQKTSTAALVCSLGHLFIEGRQYDQARDVYAQHVAELQSKREKTEVYLAAAWLEERYFSNFSRAEELIKLALVLNPQSSLAQVALARLEGRSRQRLQGEEVHAATKRRLANVCIGLEQGNATAQPEDGRVYNAWANMEVKARRYDSARKILRRAVERYPKDHSVLQAAGKVEERVGNFSGARNFYSQSLCVQPSAPTLVAYAMLELRRPQSGTMNFTMVERLFEEALMLDPRHGPAYNSYGNAHLNRGNVIEARGIFERGVKNDCTDAASVYHGYAKLELSLGNVKRAKLLLKKGLAKARRQDMGTDSPHRERASFLTHTLGMLELNSAEPKEALTIFTDGINRYGNSSQLLLGAALCEAKLGNEAKARSLFERSVVADERHAQAWQAWGVMEMRAGNWNNSRTLFQCGIKSVPRHGALWLAYATLEGRLGFHEAARSLFAHGIKKSPNHVPLYQAWASLELKLGNFTDAKALITEALTRDKRNGSGWIVAAEIERKLGNTGLVNLILRREGLNRLNKKAAAIFRTDATATSYSMGEEAWGRKIKAGRSRSVPKGVVALAQRIVEDDEAELELKTMDPGQLVDLLNTNLLESGFESVSQLLEDDESIDSSSGR